MKNTHLIKQKIAAKNICYQSIKDMDRMLVKFEQDLKEQDIYGGWINEKSDFVNMLSSYFTSKTNKVCFEIREDQKNYIINAFEESGHKVRSVSLQDLQQHKDIANTLIIKGDVAILENKSVALINKQNKYNLNSFRQIIILLDINKILYKIANLELFIQLLYQTKINQNNPIDIKFIKSSIKRKVISNGFHINEPLTEFQEVRVNVFLVNDGITDVLEDQNMIETLFCLDCNECAQVCPIYKITQKYTPIQLVKQVFVNPSFSDKEFSKYSTFCGNCNEVCPVSIQLTDLMLNRTFKYQEKHPSSATSWKYKFYSNRSKMNNLQSGLRRKCFHMLV